MSKTLLAAAAVGLLFAGTSAEAAATDEGAVSELRTLACEAGQAYARKDLEALERLSAEDYVQTDVRGKVLNRHEWLEFVKNRDSVLTIACADVSVRLYGETAVVTGGWTYTSHGETGDVVTQSRWTSVWTHANGSWKRHVFQNTYVNGKADRCAMGLPH